MKHSHTHFNENTSIKTLYVCFILNIAFVAIETVIGWNSNSTGLLSDAGHNLSDALGLLLSLVAIYLGKSKNKNNQKVSKYVTLVNGSLLLLAVIIIVIENIEKVIIPQSVDGEAVLFTSLVAIIINSATAYLLTKGEIGNINIKAAYLHAATDMLVSVGVLLSGIAIMITGLNIIDPIVSLIITAIISVPTIKLVIEAIKSIK